MLPDAWQTVSREDDAMYKLLVVLFSLEVSKFQVALRSLSSEVGIKSGYLSECSAPSPENFSLDIVAENLNGCDRLFN